MTEQTDIPSKPTMVESVELLNGYDEQRIEKHFGAPPVALSEDEPSLQGVKLFRALLFANAMRAGASEPEALDAAMKPNATQVLEGFGNSAEDGDADADEDIDPETESGKDDSADS